MTSDMTDDENPAGGTERRISPADVHDVLFSRASRLHPGYADDEVDAFLSRVEVELQRLVAEKADLRDQVRSLRRAAGSEGTVVREEPSVQAVHILAAAQQTADQYVAEAEDFSRRIAGEAREHYEQVVQQARTEADTVLREAASLAAVARDAAPAPGRDTEDLQEEVAYLKAFGQACRTQLRSYLEALLSDVEAEWGRAAPEAVAARTPRSAQDGRVAGGPGDGGRDGSPAPASNGGQVVDVRG